MNRHKMPWRVLLGGAILLFISALAWAACGSNITFQTTVAGLGHINNLVAGQYAAHWWVVGSVGKNSGTSNGGGNYWASYSGDFGFGPVWQVFGNTLDGSAAGCPVTSTDQLTMAYWQESNSGTASHTALYAVFTESYGIGGSAYNFDAIDNAALNPYVAANNLLTLQAVPAPRINSSVNNGDGTWTFGLNFNAPSYGDRMRGYYNSSRAPAGVPIQGFKAYYHIGSAPTNGDPSDATMWTPVRGTANDGVVDVLSSATGLTGDFSATVPFDRTSETLYFAYQMIFDTGYGSGNYLPILSANSNVIGNPTPAGVFASADASLKKGAVTVNWRTNVESGTANFQVLASKSDDPGSFAPVQGTLTQPKGNHSFYTATFPNPYPGAKKFYLKVQSTDFDGQQFTSNTIKITRKVAYKSGKEILLDDME